MLYNCVRKDCIISVVHVFLFIVLSTNRVHCKKRKTTFWCVGILTVASLLQEVMVVTREIKSELNLIVIVSNCSLSQCYRYICVGHFCFSVEFFFSNSNAHTYYIFIGHVYLAAKQSWWAEHLKSDLISGENCIILPCQVKY